MQNCFDHTNTHSAPTAAPLTPKVLPPEGSAVLGGTFALHRRTLASIRSSQSFGWRAPWAVDSEGVDEGRAKDTITQCVYDMCVAK